MLDLLSLGASVLGGIAGNSRANRNAREARRQFDVQMNESIQRRVNDARKAGVHPLFALGASVGGSPTFQAGGEADPQQTALTAVAEQLGVIRQNRASARRDEAEAALFDSERARIDQDMRSKASDAMKTPQDPDFPPAPTGYRNPGEGEGGQGLRFPDRIRVVDTGGNEYDLPNPDLGLDEVGQVEYVLGVPDRAVKTMRKNAATKYEIMKLEQELAYLRDARQHGGKDARTRAYQKAREIYKRYAALRNKAQRMWEQWSRK